MIATDFSLGPTPRFRRVAANKLSIQPALTGKAI